MLNVDLWALPHLWPQGQDLNKHKLLSSVTFTRTFF